MSTKIPILSVYDENGNRIPVPAIRGKSAYQYAKEGGYTGAEEEFAAKMAEENPTMEEFDRLSKQIADYGTLTLGMHTDGLVYIFKNGSPVGVGIELPEGGGLGGYIDSENNIVLKGNYAAGTRVKYEMDDGTLIDIGEVDLYYSVTNNLINCTNSNGATQAVIGSSYAATITANSGYELKSVTVTMGGQAVSVSDGTINIASVTGNIVITAVAESTVVEPINLLPTAAFTDSEMSSFTDAQKQESANGYVSGYRLSASKGSLSASATSFVSGFMPVGVNDTVTIENIELDQSSGNVNNVVFYNSAKEFVYGVGGPSGGKVFGDGVTVNNGVYTFTPTSCGAGGKAVGYFRFSCAGITPNSIVKVTKG